MTLEASLPAKACVIGWPVAHSRSPMIHGFWLKQLEIAGSYERAAVPPEAFPAFLLNLVQQGFIGANVTLPHKEAAFALCEEKLPAAQRLKAVNTVWIEDGKLCGDNTDAEGFLEALDQEAPAWSEGSGSAVVIGAGGAARAIVFALLSRGFSQIHLFNRSAERAKKLVEDFGEVVKLVDRADLPAAMSKVKILINSTSLGMKGQPPLKLDLSPLPATALVSDIVYVPLKTQLIHDAEACGLKAVPGLGMLLHQGVPGFTRWFGKKPVVTQELRHLIEAHIASTC